MYLSRTVLTCEDLGRDTSLTLYVKDKVGNIDSCTTIITVKDTVAPVLECKSEISLVLDNQGMATLSSEDVLINMTENIDCNNASTKLNLSKTSFSCSDIGSQNVAFEAIDVAGNSATCSVQVTVMDDIGACNCQDTALIKNEKPITEGRYVTSKNISSAGVISKNTAVSFVAKEYIILKPGFHAEKESTFSARIDDCSQSNSIVPLETALTKPQLKQNKLTEIADPIAVKVRPNPFLGNTTIQFNLTTSEAIDIMIHDLAGKQIAVLAKQTFYEKGVHQIRFDASGQAPGMYLLILKTKDQRVIKKMVLSR
jgi:hypothetical protein